MIDVIKQQFKEGMSTDHKLNLTREFLQILCLKIMYEKKIFDQVAFWGGTSLRILYDIKRFSEDLDFSLTDKKKYSFIQIHQQLSKAFALYNLPFEAKPRTESNVHSMMMRFTGLLKALGVSAMQSQKFSIKFEIDTNPPLGWNLANTLVGKFFNFTVTHYDLPSLYAGKLHACFYRKFIKGRDYYDFVWYLTKKIKPNFVLLNNAIKQTQGVDLGINENNFKTYLAQNIESIDFEKVKKDVGIFLEDKSELSLFDAKIIQENISAAY